MSSTPSQLPPMRSLKCVRGLIQCTGQGLQTELISGFCIPCFCSQTQQAQTFIFSCQTLSTKQQNIAIERSRRHIVITAHTCKTFLHPLPHTWVFNSPALV